MPATTTATYVVPKRFGMAGILAITTFMAGLFGILRWFDCHPVIYIFLGVLALVTCLVQMRYGDVPRMASIAVGALFLPLCAMGTLFFVNGFRAFPGLLCSIPLLAVGGAVLGYIAGAMTAGIFLLMDLVEANWPGGHQPGKSYAQQIARQREQGEIVMASLATEAKFPPPPPFPPPEV